MDVSDGTHYTQSHSDLYCHLFLKSEVSKH